MMPSVRPPTITPGTLPNPPRTQITNALPRRAFAVSGEIGNMTLNRLPAAPAMAAPRPKVMA